MNVDSELFHALLRMEIAARAALSMSKQVPALDNSHFKMLEIKLVKLDEIREKSLISR